MTTKRAKKAKTTLVRVKVVAVSDNANTFGLHGVVIMTRAGKAWEIGVSISELDRTHGPRKGREYDLEITDGMPARIDRFCFEIPRELPDAPEAVIKEVWT